MNQGFTLFKKLLCLLFCSTPNEFCNLKYAYFIYGEELIKNNLLPPKVGSYLIESYAWICQQFVEDPDTINAEHRQYIENIKHGGDIGQKNPRLALAEIAVKDSTEYNNFLADCQGNYGNGEEKQSTS